MQPITVIIPTIGGREDTLQQALQGLEQQTLGLDAFELIIVQDGGGGAPLPSSPLLPRTRVFRHETRRGAAAARNTALDHTRTGLGLFMDDDIVPTPGVLEAHLAFHRKHQDPLVMGAGRVSWRGHPQHNGLMTWNETQDWSVFLDLAPDQCFPYWVSGFTSFQVEIMRRLRFNEAFTRYACEDHELGYRFFREGGRLRFIDQAEGLHLKRVTSESTYQDHRHGAWSKWVLGRSYPDATGTPTSLITAIQMDRQGEDPAPIIAMLDRFAGAARNRMTVSTDLLMPFLCGLAACHGMLDYWRAEYPGFDAAADRLFQGFVAGQEGLAECVEAALRACPSMPWIQLYAARHGNPEARAALLRGLLGAHPTYALVFLEHLAQLTDPAEVEREADRFFPAMSRCLERSTEQNCAYRAGMILLRHGRLRPATALLEAAADFECWDEGQLVCARRALRELKILHAVNADPAVVNPYEERQYRMPAGAVRDMARRLDLCGPDETLLSGHMKKWLELMGEPPRGAIG
jgi:GT2 family glycosyltransferase